jgi:hypothetical protein
MSTAASLDLTPSREEEPGALHPRLDQIEALTALTAAKYVDWLEAVPGWAWEVAGKRKQYGDPIDLDGWPHGTGKGIAAGCPCRECLDARRAYDRRRLAEAREVADGVPAGPACHHIARLEAGGAKRYAITAVSGVPLGTVRKVASGDWRTLSREHEQAILAVTAAQCQTAATSRVGSRGRAVAADTEQIDARPTWAILDDLKSRGFGMLWVSRELGYIGGMQIRRDVISCRVAEQVAALAARVGDLTYPRIGNRRVPPLADLLAEGDQTS